MRRITSVLAAGALAFALAVPAVDAGASAPRPDDSHAWSWLQQVATSIWAVLAGSGAGSGVGSAAAATTSGSDTGPDWDPNGFADPDPGSGSAGPTTGPDQGPEWDPNG